MRTYPIICPSCSGTGMVRNNAPHGTSSVLDCVCPACNGQKWVMCSETDGFFPKEGITHSAKCPTCQGQGGIDLGRVFCEGTQRD